MSFRVGESSPGIFFVKADTFENAQNVREIETQDWPSSIQEYALQHGGQYKSYYFVEKSKCHKISPLNAFPLKFRV